MQCQENNNLPVFSSGDATSLINLCIFFCPKTIYFDFVLPQYFVCLFSEVLSYLETFAFASLILTHLKTSRIQIEREIEH